MAKKKAKKKEQRTEPDVDLDVWVLEQVKVWTAQASTESEKRLFGVLCLCARLVAGEVRALRQDLQRQDSQTTRK